MVGSSAEELRRRLERIDGRGYPAYRDIAGAWTFGDFVLHVDHVQGDPFATPSRLRVHVPAAVAGFPPELRSSRARSVALRDFLTRRLAEEAGRASRRRGSGRSGLVGVDRPGQEVLERSSCVFRDADVEARFVAGLPAAGRRVLGREAATLLCEDVPAMVDRALRHAHLDPDALRRHVETVEDAVALRAGLAARGLVGFVADGAILPRASGVDDRPLGKGAVPFEAPESLRVVLERPNGAPVSGMGIPRGVTLIVGGGYHGKSTLLRALEVGVYDHVPGDGRERVVADPAAVKIRAEDGRRVERVDISPFIGALPGGRPTRDFSTDDASGSTSQATNIVEALEAGARVLLLDEDTSATNFMIRDRRMQALVAREDEPIMPFVDRVRELFDTLGVSTVLVMGGSGDYLDVADTVIAMREFVPQDVTGRAREIARRHPTERDAEAATPLTTPGPRIPVAASLDPSSGRKSVRVRARDTDAVTFGSEEIDLSAVAQIVHPAQTRAIAEAMVHARRHHMTDDRPLARVLDAVLDEIEEKGLDVLVPSPRGDLAAFRRFELAAAIDRLRSLRVRR